MSHAFATQGTDADITEFWRRRIARQSPPQAASPATPSPMEGSVHLLQELKTAPPRTLHSAPIVKSSPLSPPVRHMIETRSFSRRFDEYQFDLAEVASRLPGLSSTEADVDFFADDSNLGNLSLSVDGLLQHRKQLLASTINPNCKRRNVLIVGAGPAGLMAAVQLLLRNHQVVVIEQREVYSRNRYIGVYKEVTHLLAALGMPENMTYDFSQYRGKRGVMLADIQTFLHAIALKLGAVIYTGAVLQSLDRAQLANGVATLERAQKSESQSDDTVGITRWRYDHVCRVSSGVTVDFDTIIEASGGRSGLREAFVGKDNVVSIHEIGRGAVLQDPTLSSFLDDPEDHCAEYVESGYGCPPGSRPLFAAALLSEREIAVPEEIPCFVSNIDAAIFKVPMQQADGSLGLASRIADRELNIPHDWVVLECRVSDRRLSRYHIEGPLPQHFEFGGSSFDTRDVLDKLNPVSLLLRILYAMGVPFDAVDRRQLVDFYTSESSYTDASDIVGTWVGRFRSLKVGNPTPIWSGMVPGSSSIEYGILGESLQNAWYRFGVGVDDAFNSAEFFAASLDLEGAARLSYLQKLERVMRSRAVQILYHLFAVAQNTEQGVVGSVLTEYHMEEQHSRNLAEAKFRDLCNEGREMFAVASDLPQGSGGFLQHALDSVRKRCCRHALELLKALAYKPAVLQDAQACLSGDHKDWASRIRTIVAPMLSEKDRVAFLPLVGTPDSTAPRSDSDRRHCERISEIAANRYKWITPWLRACALRDIDTCDQAAKAILIASLEDRDPIVAQAAREVLNGIASSAGAVRTTLFERIAFLERVNIFNDATQELLAEVALHLTEVGAEPEQSIIRKGEAGDAMYILIDGRVEVLDEGRHIRFMGPGEFFGELSLLDSEPRAATVVAVEPTRLYKLARDVFHTLLEQHPEISRALNRALCRLVRGN